MRAVFFARLLRHFLAKSTQLSRLNHLAEQANIGAKYLPGTLVLGPNENPPRHVPLIVRELVGQARRVREVCRAVPTAEQPFRAGAGPIAETGGVWASWEEASGEVHDARVRERSGRRDMLRELALTLSHELGNALVSLTTFRHAGPERPIPASLGETIRGNIAELETLNNSLALMQSLHEAKGEVVDIRDVVQRIGNSLNLKTETGQEPVMLSVSRRLLEYALRALVKTLAENRPDLGTKELVLKLRWTGSGADQVALLSIRGKALELEGILPEPVRDEVPNLGRIGVFLAKEILRLHHGEIHAGPGLEGTEILISVRSL